MLKTVNIFITIVDFFFFTEGTKCAALRHSHSLFRIIKLIKTRKSTLKTFLSPARGLLFTQRKHNYVNNLCFLEYGQES
jgi:hypothetical protein